MAINRERISTALIPKWVMRNKATQNPILATSCMRFSSLAKPSIIYAVPSAASNREARRTVADPYAEEAFESCSERPQFTFKAERGYSCLMGNRSLRLPAPFEEAVRPYERPRLIAALPYKQREPLTMRKVVGLNYGEIAAALGCSVEGARANVSLALQKTESGVERAMSRSGSGHFESSNSARAA